MQTKRSGLAAPHREKSTAPAPLNTGGPSSLGEVIAWLDRHINLEAIESGLAGRAALPTLDRIRTLTDAMGDPQRDYEVLHITGTNGKGSTTRMCSTLLYTSGLSVGTITSPHLETMNERISTNLRPISDAALDETLRALRHLEAFLLERGSLDMAPTWFELVTTAAYRYFSDVAVQAAVVEVGLGGRWDATNIADGSVAAVTNVDLDHVEILGPTRTHIAKEKAGIVKAGSIVVVGERDPEIVEIFAEEARAVGAEDLWQNGIDFACESNDLAVGGRLLSLRTRSAHYHDVYLPLHGRHQGDNAAVAIAATEAFVGVPLSEDVVREAFAGVTVPGRLEVMERHPLIVLDGAHNVAGAQVLHQALEEDFAGVRAIVLVMGCLRGRSPAELISQLGSDRLRQVVACTPPSPRAQHASVVADAARALGLAATICEDADDAITAARALVTPEDMIVVCGSLYVVGAARTALRRVASATP